MTSVHANRPARENPPQRLGHVPELNKLRELSQAGLRGLVEDVRSWESPNGDTAQVLQLKAPGMTDANWKSHLARGVLMFDADQTFGSVRSMKAEVRGRDPAEIRKACAALESFMGFAPGRLAPMVMRALDSAPEAQFVSGRLGNLQKGKDFTDATFVAVVDVKNREMLALGYGNLLVAGKPTA